MVGDIDMALRVDAMRRLRVRFVLTVSVLTGMVRVDLPGARSPASR
jgi:hypothetical protein